MMKKIIVILISVVLLSVNLFAQDSLLISQQLLQMNSSSLIHTPESPQLIENNKNYTVPIVISAGTNLAAAVPVYNHMTSAWGLPDGKFHFKDDWSGDNLALNDEISHLFVSYKLMQFFNSGYNFVGFSPKTAKILGIVETAFIVTAVEFPIDAFNPDQGFGISDLIFDYAGIAMAYMKITNPALKNWDIKTSLKSLSYSNKNVIGSNSEDYDNYIYWLTYRKSPAVFGLGYSTDHPQPYQVDKQFYLAIGTTVPDLVRLISPKIADKLNWMEVYYFNLKWNFATLK